MKAEIVSVGTELLLGHITDTNAPYLAQNLADLGIDVYWISQAGDNLGRLSETIGRAWNRSDLVVITGGLGPTEDDLTREAITHVLGETMEVQADLEQQLRAFFAGRGVKMPESNVKQATLIKSARAISNPVGTAPGWWVERDGHVIVAMPGVPVEMRRMWENEVMPALRASQGGSLILHRTVKVIGLGESSAEDMVRHLMKSTNPTVAPYAKSDGIHLRISAKASSRDLAEPMVAGMEARIRDILGNFVYGVDDETLAAVTGRLLQAAGLTVGVVETCTGGDVVSGFAEDATMRCRLAGGIVVGRSGVVDGVSVQTDMEESPETADHLAKIARSLLKADLGIGVTGNDHGSTDKGGPQGTIHLALYDGKETVSTTQSWRMIPSEVRRLATLSALNLVRRKMLDRG